MTIVGKPPTAPLDQRAADGLVTSHPIDIAQRTCGRCRRRFPGDPTLHPGALAEWWACDDCRRQLGIAVNPPIHSC